MLCAALLIRTDKKWDPYVVNTSILQTRWLLCPRVARLNSPDPIARSRIYRIILWSAAIATILAGVYLSQIRFLGTEWLSRSGCLVVILGIWSSLGSIVQERVLSSRMRWRRRNAIRKAKARIDAGEFSAEEAEETLQKIDLAFDTKVAELTQNLRLSLGVVEVSLLMTGTFLWGFGDLLMG